MVEVRYFILGKRGRWYHKYPNCVVLSLADSDVELKEAGFVKVTLGDIQHRKLHPCLCAQEAVGGKPLEVSPKGKPQALA